MYISREIANQFGVWNHIREFKIHNTISYLGKTERVNIVMTSILKM